MQTAPELSKAFRSAWDDLRNDYHIGKTSRYRPRPSGVSVEGTNADYHYRTERQFLLAIERARDFDRNNMVIGQGVNRLVANVIQDGFTLDVRTGNRQVDKELYSRWEEWASDPEACDYEGEKTFADFEALNFRHVIVDGDVFNLPLADYGSLQAVEAHRVRTPSNTTKNVVHGVEMFTSGRRMRYWITKEDLDPNRQLSRVSDTTQIDARDEMGRKQVLHIYAARRFSQRRGVTAFAPAVDAIGMHDDIQFAHLVQAQVAACFAIFEETDFAPPGRSSSAVGIKTGSTDTSTSYDDGTTRTLEGVSPGMRVKGAAGVKLQGFSPNIPNPEFFPHATLILTFIAINLDLPVAVLLLDPRQTNFSSWRGSIDQARMRFRQMQRWYIRAFHQQVYTWKVRQWAESNDRLGGAMRRMGPRFFSHRWNPPTWRYIEPNKDAMADDLRVTRNLISQRRRAAEQGYDFDDLLEEIIEDRAAVIERAIERATQINNRFPESEVDWRELAYGHQTSGITYTYGADLSQEDTSDAADD